MSRVGKAPIAVPAKVTVSVEKDNLVTVSGPKGALTQKFDPDMKITVENGQLTVSVLPSTNRVNPSIISLFRFNPWEFIIDYSACVGINKFVKVSVILQFDIFIKPVIYI